MITTILVALDDKPIAARVLAVATEIADRFDARMLLLRVIHVPPEFPAAAGGASRRDPLAAHLHARAAEELAALARDNARASAEAPILISGEPWRTIVEAGDVFDADLIVMGSHVHRWPDRLLGTNAGHLANQGHRDVLIVHER